jgi:hypothetical protein
MSTRIPKCQDCGKFSVPKAEWPRLKQEDLDKVCRCLVKIDPKVEVPATPMPPPSRPAIEPVIQTVSRAPAPRSKSRPDYLAWIMGAIGVLIFVYGVAFFLLAGLEFLGRSTAGEFNDSSSFFLRLYLSFAFMGGGAVVYLLAKISHLIWKGQNWRA